MPTAGISRAASAGAFEVLRRALAISVALCCLTWLPVSALETDQYYAWDREIVDSTEILNAKVNIEIRAALHELNTRRGGPPRKCENVAKRISSHFRFFIFQDIELWAVNTPLVDRVPSTPEEELRYRDEYIYRGSPFFDPVRWMPPSPTIELAGVRIGTDKLSHFFSGGWYYYRWHRNWRRDDGLREQLEQRILTRGMFYERTVLGGTSSGVLSIGDLEANHRGMEFLLGLCSGDEPQLRSSADGWRLTRPFDFRQYVSPEWDESWQPAVFSERRWRDVVPVLRQYCPLLDDPRVVERRRRYAERETTTVTERFVAGLVAAGRLPDPDLFTLERACSDRPATRPLEASNRADGVRASGRRPQRRSCSGASSTCRNPGSPSTICSRPPTGRSTSTCGGEDDGQRISSRSIRSARPTPMVGRSGLEPKLAPLPTSR